MLTHDDVDAYVEFSALEAVQSGTDGDPISTPYSKDEPFDRDEIRRRTLKRWSTPITGLGWRRTWGTFENGQLIGQADLCGADLRSANHRVQLGMGVRRGYRRQGLGQALLETLIVWARTESSISWIDLGVFVGNDPALALYLKNGFIECGRTVDRFRVDGHKVEDIHMCLNVD
jgi:RimJ/RimL family protein N-acetyltransferase